ncbi:MAG: FtsX-like permease family protein [Clostridiaceae bacterium]
MKFRDIAIKNLKGNIKKYLTYLLCNAFIVMNFFMYSTLMFNEKLKNSGVIDGEVLNSIMVPNVALAIFSLFFISYSHSTFIKGRKKEFGVFMTLGMLIKDLRRLILIENLIIAAISILIGIITGLVFSRLFFLGILKVLNISNIPYEIGILNFIFPIGIFLLIYLVNLLITIISTCNFEVANLLKEDRKNKINKFNSPIVAFTALIAIMVTSIVLYKGFNNPEEKTSQLLLETTIIIFISLYIFIAQLGGTLINLCKKNKKIYCKRIIWLSGINSKFKSSKKIIFLSAILVSVVIFYLGGILGTYLKAEKQAVYNNPYDFSFCQYEDKYNFSRNHVEEIVKKYHQEITEEMQIEFICTIYRGEGTSRYIDKCYLKNSDIRKLTGENIELNKDSSKYLDYSDKQSEKLNSVIRLIRSGGIKVIDDNVYDNLKNSVEVYERASLHFYNVTDWKKSKGIVDELGIERFNARILDYNYNRQGGTIVLFTLSYLSVFFFLATIIILFLKLLSEVDNDKEKYKNLYRIGTTTKELKSQIRKELRIVFFTGPVLGVLISLIYAITFSKDEPVEFKYILIYCCIVVGLVFFVVQYIYYLLSKKQYYKYVLK